MIRITVELVPFGDETLTEVLGKITIANDCSSRTLEYGNYIAETSEGTRYWLRRHKRSDGWLPLVAKVLGRIVEGQRKLLPDSS